MGSLSCSIIHLVLILQLQTFFVFSQNIRNGSVPVGESLTASESQQISSSWRSPSGDFAFGFRKIQPNDGFTLSIWFDKISDKTIVWHAQAVNTTTGLVPNGSKVTLTADGGLVIADPRGQELWRALSGGSVSRGRFTDDGNFVLFRDGSEDSDEVLWSSFENPTDTLLPNQNIEVGRNLSSRRTETSFKKGRFSLRLEDDGNLQLHSLNAETASESDIYSQYYESNTNDPNNPGIQLVFNQSGEIYVLQRNNSRFVVKDRDPDFSIAAPFYISTGFLLSTIIPKEARRIVGNNKRPKCECPERFVLKDPSNEYGDCLPDFEMQTCRPENQTANSDVNLYEFITLEKTNWPFGDYESYANYDEERCKASCLSDCLCAAVIFGTNRDLKCWKKKFPLSHGERSPRGDSDTFIKTKKSKNMMKNQARDIGRTTATTTANELNLRVFTYGELAEATRDFTEELGRGAFGIVYKGYLEVAGGSEVTVAVKKLDRLDLDNEKEFKNEVKVIGQIHHKNLVRLIGFCNEGQSQMIVYEFLPQGTLANFLFRRPRPSWEDRKNIAVAIARGILYLHEECSEQIIHCDIKPQNILLDEYYTPRISDFGLAKLLLMNQTYTLTNIRGTKGYVAPEWFRNSPITSKVDVYSYGVMLLEIVCCKKAVDLEDNVILINWAYDCFRQGRLEDLTEEDSEAMDDMDTVERYVKIAIWCIQEEHGMRPNMRNVTQMLEGVTQVFDPPNPSPYSTFTWSDESLSSDPVSLV
ncbi:Bulb-type lectin domain [Arabidopsis thaliana x Arabidopsis arenosa]|uniref:Receptor-like serine/threonine-protein kinase n=1 Tax=Arabidopsis thaliana x Arabidopsis arenosa TaxID=1240361 RepID=A0A8T2D5T8_9BRAS|nr:Bulb-type lectin domain [Arabidopsis thaliana x Arabidopsis arenosa]